MGVRRFPSTVQKGRHLKKHDRRAADASNEGHVQTMARPLFRAELYVVSRRHVGDEGSLRQRSTDKRIVGSV